MRETEHILGTPIVFERSKKRKKKKKGKRSGTLKDAHTTERHLSKAVKRSVRAAERGTAGLPQSQ